MTVTLTLAQAILLLTAWIIGTTALAVAAVELRQWWYWKKHSMRVKYRYLYGTNDETED